MKISSSIQPKTRPSVEEWVKEFRVGSNSELPKCERAIYLNSQYTFNKVRKKYKINLLEMLLGVS